MATLTSEYQYIGRSAQMKARDGSYYYYILLYAKTVPNNSTGYHTVTIKQVLACEINSSFYQYTTTFSGTIAGTTVFSGSNKPWAAWELGTFAAGGYTYNKGTVIAEGSKQVDCTDGTAKSVSLSTTWKFTSHDASYTPEKNTVGSVTATATLAAIPRATEITATDANIGSTSTVIFNTKNANFRHTLAYMTGSTYTTIFEKQSYTTYGWTVPTSIYAQIPNSKGCSVRLRCQTYSGDTLIGTKYAYIYVTASEELCKPSITVTTCQDTNAKTVALTGDATKIVKGHSNVRVVTTASGNNSATITSVKVTCGGKTLTGTDVTITGAESKDITVTATDSRGYQNSENPTMTLVDYFPVTATLSVARDSPTSDTVNISIKGKYFNSSFGAVSNTLSVKARFALSGGTYGEDTTIPVTISGNEYTATGSLTGLDYDKTYDVQITYTDAVAAQTRTVSVAKGTPVFDWGENDFRFNVPVFMPVGTEIEGMPDHIISCGTWNGWTWRKWSSGLAECWRTVKCEGIVCATAFGAVYETAKAYGNLLYPGAIGFTARPQQHLSVSYTSGLALMLEEPFGTNSNTQSGTGSWYFWRPKASTEADSVTAYVDIYAVGRWKNA